RIHNIELDMQRAHAILNMNMRQGSPVFNINPLPQINFLQPDAFLHNFRTVLSRNNAIFCGFNILSKQSSLRPYLSQGIHGYSDTAQSDEKQTDAWEILRRK